MFDFLKKKIGGFVKSLEANFSAVEPKDSDAVDKSARKEEETAKEKTVLEEKTALEAASGMPAPERKEPGAEAVGIAGPAAEKKMPGIPKPEAPLPKPGAEIGSAQAPSKSKAPEEAKATTQPAKPELKKSAGPVVGKGESAPKAPEAEGGQMKTPRLKVGIFDTLKSVVTGQISIAERDVAPMLEELELGLLESDVALEVSEGIRRSLQGRLIGMKVGRGRLQGLVKESIEQTLLELLENPDRFDLVERVGQGPAPLKIMFLGPNGAGKTTTMAKVAHLLAKEGKRVVFAAGDTFRAAAIEQLGVHAERLKVPIIKRPYGSDATAVAFDAVAYAKAHGIDAVLIDTAGRQDTNINLINELKKMQRVIQPDLKIYIGESIAGNALLEQVGTFHRELGVDGVILTKLDCDPKGGTMLSVSKATGRPILYLGVGQGYDDLEVFEARSIVKRILS